MNGKAVEPLDLDRPRDLGMLLNAAANLYGRFFAVFVGIAILVVVPVDIVFYGILGGQLGGYDSNPDQVGLGIAALASYFVSAPLITAMHVRAVQDVGEGKQPTLGATASSGAAVFGVLLATLVLMWFLLVLGFIALVIPGLFLSVRWYVTPQAVVVEGKRGPDALRRSWELTKDNWWRMFGITLLTGLMAAIAAGIFALPAVLAAETVGAFPIELVAQIFSDAISLSFTALIATLLFFDLRARKSGRSLLPDHPVQPPPPVGSYPPPPPPRGPEAP